MLGLILGLIISGLIVGALGRLAIPGPNPMSIVVTIAVGIGGSLIGGLIGRALVGEDGSTTVPFVLGVLAAAAIVWFMQRRPATR